MAHFSELKNQLSWMGNIAPVIVVTLNEETIANIGDVEDPGEAKEWKVFHDKFLDKKTISQIEENGYFYITGGYKVNTKQDDELLKREHFVLTDKQGLLYIASLGSAIQDTLTYGVRLINKKNGLVFKPGKRVYEGKVNTESIEEVNELIDSITDEVESALIRMKEQEEERIRKKKEAERKKKEAERRKREELANRPPTPAEIREKENEYFKNLHQDLLNELDEHLNTAFDMPEFTVPQLDDSVLSDNPKAKNILSPVVNNTQREINYIASKARDEINERRQELIEQYRQDMREYLNEAFDNLREQTTVPNDAHPNPNNRFGDAFQAIDKNKKEQLDKLDDIVIEQRDRFQAEFQTAMDEHVKEQVRKIKDEFESLHYDEMVADKVEEFRTTKEKEIEEAVQSQQENVRNQANSSMNTNVKYIVPRAFRTHEDNIENDKGSFETFATTIIKNAQLNMDRMANTFNDKLNEQLIKFHENEEFRREAVEQEVAQRMQNATAIERENESLRKQNEQFQNDYQSIQSLIEDSKNQHSQLKEAVEEVSTIVGARKEKDTKTKSTKRYIMGGVGVAAALLLAIGAYWYGTGAKSDVIEQQRATIASQEERLKELEKQNDSNAFDSNAVDLSDVTSFEDLSVGDLVLAQTNDTPFEATVIEKSEGRILIEDKDGQIYELIEPQQESSSAEVAPEDVEETQENTQEETDNSTDEQNEEGEG